MILNVLDLAREYWGINFPNRDVSTIDVSNVQVEVSGINPDTPIRIPIPINSNIERTVETKVVTNSNDTKPYLNENYIYTFPIDTYLNEVFNFSVPIDTVMQTTVEQGVVVDGTGSNLQINGIIEFSSKNQTANPAFITQINMAGQTITNQKIYVWTDGASYSISPQNTITATFSLYTLVFNELVNMDITVSGTVRYMSNRREIAVPIGILFQEIQVPGIVYDLSNEDTIIYPGKIRFQGRVGEYSELFLQPAKITPLTGFPYVQRKFGPTMYIF